MSMRRADFAQLLIRATKWTRTYRQPHRPDAHRWGLLIDLRGCAGDPTHALLSGQSQSIRDNVMALFGAIRAWNCSAANLARTGRISAMWNRIPIERCPGQVGVCYPLDC